MAKCLICGNETNLFVGGEPLCPECDDRTTAAKKLRESAASTPARKTDDLRSGVRGNCKRVCDIKVEVRPPGGPPNSPRTGRLDDNSGER